MPQMLNLDIDEFGVNFSKGCYPGQEVVARLHYLGEASVVYFLLRLNQKCKLVTIFIAPPLKLQKLEVSVIKAAESL